MSDLERHAQPIQWPPAPQNRLPFLRGQGEEMDDFRLGQPTGEMIPPEILPVQLLHDSPLPGGEDTHRPAEFENAAGRGKTTV
jgi:hypothetical protein